MNLQLKVIFGINVVDPSVWIRGCRVTGSLE